jgi:DNA replication protein DnaC
MVKALLQTKEDMQNYMKQYREINKDKIYQLQQKSYNCPYCDRENIHVYYKNQHEKTKYCLSRRKSSHTLRLKSQSGDPAESIIKQITD